MLTKDNICNIYCVGRNYGLHAAELGNEVPEEPMIFMKPTHALVSMEGQTVKLPGNRGELHYEGELVLFIGREYFPGSRVEKLVAFIAFGIDFTLRDVQAVLKRQGRPWLPAKGFLQSAAIGPLLPFPGVEKVKEVEYTLRKNGETVQRGNLNEMIFDFQTLIDYIGGHYGLGAGDLIYTGTPAGVAAVRDGDRFELWWGDEPCGAMTVQLEK